MKRRILISIILVLFILIGTVQAASSPHFRIDWMIPLVSGGGGQAESAGLHINYSVGQTAIGQSYSTSYRGELGFWQEFMFLFPVHLPIVLR